MGENINTLLYIVVMAGVTYLIRAIPLVLFRKKIENTFIRSFLYYIPYAVLAAMTIPAILYSTGSMLSAIIGMAVAIVISFFEKGLVTVALSACGAVIICDWIIKLI